MISAESFAHDRPSYWNQLLPRLEPFVRLLNLSAGRFSPPMVPSVARERRAFVAELGFELFRLAAGDASGPDEVMGQAAALAVRERIARLSGFAVDDVPGPSAVERDQATTLANRLRRFVQQRWASSFAVNPQIPGCGIVDGATADLLISRPAYPFLSESDGDDGGPPALVEHLLYEVKTVTRPFRADDVRQLITYSALMTAAGGPPVTVGVVNPRLGTFVECPLDRLAIDIAGVGANSLMQQIIFDVSAAEISL